MSAPSPRAAALSVVGACCIWGLSPLYYAQLSHVPPLEVLAHRTVWTLLAFGAWAALAGRLGEVRTALSDRRELGRLALAAAMVSVNWGLFIWAISTQRIAESALGYYIYPLVMAALGRALLDERLRPLQLAAVALAAIATLILGLGAGAPPWLSLTLAVTFAIYGLVKRGGAAGPMVSVAVEVLILSPLAILWLIGVHAAGWTDFTGLPGAAFFSSGQDAALLLASGLITGLPLALITRGARGLPFAAVGMIFYLNPTLQAACALALGEQPTLWQMVAFPLIWAGLALYSAEAWGRERAARRARRAGAGAGAPIP